MQPVKRNHDLEFVILYSSSAREQGIWINVRVDEGLPSASLFLRNRSSGHSSTLHTIYCSSSSAAPTALDVVLQPSIFRHSWRLRFGGGGRNEDISLFSLAVFCQPRVTLRLHPHTTSGLFDLQDWANELFAQAYVLHRHKYIELLLLEVPHVSRFISIQGYYITVSMLFSACLQWFHEL